MGGRCLSGMERQLVLAYLADGNSPVSVVLLDEYGAELPVSASFRIVPESRRFSSLFKPALFLEKSDSSAQFPFGRRVKVRFYFNKLGMVFITELCPTPFGAALALPSTIEKSGDDDCKKSIGFSAVVYYDLVHHGASNSVECLCRDGYELFSAPGWGSISGEFLKSAKSYVKASVELLRKEKRTVGNGLYLIPIGRYLCGQHDEALSSVETRRHPPEVIYLDSGKIVFAAKKSDMIFSSGREYRIEMHIPIHGPLKSRKVCLSCVISEMHESYDRMYLCACAEFTSIKREDVRFLHDLNSSAVSKYNEK